MANIPNKQVGGKWWKKRGNSIPSHQKYTFKDFETEFPNESACLETLKEMRWPDGRTHCTACRSIRKHHRVSGRTCYACEGCGHHIFPLVGTIFENTKLPLKTWFYAIKIMAASRCGVSAKQIQRETGVTYKTAWRMAKHIRKLMEEGLQVAGEVEMDETYYGKQKGKNLTQVIGMVERRGRVIALAAENRQGSTLMKIVRERILPSSMVYTDSAGTYGGLESMRDKGYLNKRVRHSAKVYVAGDAHTNTIEGFWSLVKRGIAGTYHAVSRKYLQSYLNEYAFRYNHRNSSIPMFAVLLGQVYRAPVELPF